MRHRRIKCSIDVHLNLDGDCMSCFRWKDYDAAENIPDNNLVIFTFPEMHSVEVTAKKEFAFAKTALDKGFSPPVRLPEFYSESAKNTIADCYQGFQSGIEGQDWEH